MMLRFMWDSAEGVNKHHVHLRVLRVFFDPFALSEEADDVA